jgi:hypothetical protein
MIAQVSFTGHAAASEDGTHGDRPRSATCAALAAEQRLAKMLRLAYV